MAETSEEVIRRYLQDAIAAERSFETQLESFSKQAGNPAAQEIFRTHATETRYQHERLTTRLTELGGSPSTAKGFLAHILGATSKAAQSGDVKESDTTTQCLMVAFAVENSELAMYEALATIAEAAGDPETETLARAIQAEEKAAADRIWRALPGVVEAAIGAPDSV